jgi:DNA (cytosine-5)-methyltransferase 1
MTLTSVRQPLPPPLPDTDNDGLGTCSLLAKLCFLMIGIDLFCGAGGMSLGAAQAGIRVELAVEADPHAAKTYGANHEGVKVFAGDIRTLSARHLARWKKAHDRLVVFGGPPCQGFSWSNVRTRNQANPDNWLFEEFLRAVTVLKPAWIVFENVQGIVNTAKGGFLSQIKDRLAEEYSLTHRLLNSKHYGVPQDRTRFFLVGARNGATFRFPKSSPAAPLTVDDAIRDLPRLENGDGVCWLKYGKAAPSKYGQRMQNGQDGCCNHLVTRNAAFVLKRYRYVPQGGNWEDIPARLMRNYEDRSRCHTGIYHRLRSGAPSIVIGNYRKNMLIHPTQDRGLSVREAARIQSFPDWFIFRGSIGFQQQQVGNAVPPLLAEAVFRSILRAHQSGRH